jgi:hypothetical protein
MRKLFGLFALLLVVAGPSPGWAQEPGTSLVTIVHGLPRFTADIYVDGDLVLSGFKPKDTTDPIPMPAGDYEVEIRNAGAAENSEPALAAELAVPEGKNLSVVAHLDEAGNPTVSVFDNDVARVPAGKSRLLVRHQAEAPPIDLEVDGRNVLTGVASGDQEGQPLSASGHEFALVMARGGEELVQPTPIDLEEGTAYFLYLIGSAQGETLDVMVQQVDGLQSGPTGVATGNGGLAETPGFPAWAAALVAVSAVTLAVSEVRRRRVGRSG